MEGRNQAKPKQVWPAQVLSFFPNPVIVAAILPQGVPLPQPRPLLSKERNR
jgi:hypothetical protein